MSGRLRGCGVGALPVLLLLLLRAPATPDTRERLAAMKGKSNITENSNPESQAHRASLRPEAPGHGLSGKMVIKWGKQEPPGSHSSFHEERVQQKLALRIMAVDTHLAQRWEKLQQRVTGLEELFGHPREPADKRQCVNGSGPRLPSITCPTPTPVKHADIWVKSYNLNSRERYVCNSGFKRKAGTSSLTECMFNKTVNIAHWTTPNLKCIRDPSLTHQRPPSTAAPTGVTPEPDSPNPSGKEPAFTSKSDTTVATRLATGPGSRLMPSKAPSAGTTGVVKNEPSQVPAQTTAKAPEHTPSASQDPPG
ncbi:PREDICTED: interleukin-15 receptor subunit alpha [Lipotes vexillifer]|uniref:Interleukin-15 receptor subunit alpha n=1 Tax=Lipotes vexillifer TaxID=118797 RepID=A0A340XX13_LIPVE|nr:PREDICTED: interleukin-15 receptor subunit alpha [Lipotes vexillifer]